MTLTCAHDGSHWYGQSWSGYGNGTDGTEIQTTTPANWSVDQNANSTTDEAAWLINHNNQINSVEAGYYSGYWPYGGGWTNGLVPYYTTDDGAGGQHASNYYIPASTAAGMWVLANGSNTQVTVYGWSPILAYSVGTPRWNYMQGEVTLSTNTWMGGGSGEGFTGYWVDTSGAGHNWGFHSDCSNSPYWVSSSGASSWSNGGS